MKLIFPGDKFPIWSEVRTCARCGATLDITEADLRIKESPLMKAHFEVLLDVYARCCACGFIIVLSNDIPSAVIERNIPKIS